MAYKNKAEQEKEFVEQIITAGGIKSYGITEENGHEYWFFNLNNGGRRYWTNLAEDSQRVLGINAE